MKYSDVVYGNYLKHYGVLGMKWGIRRYQNADGTLTEAGKKRYGTIQAYEWDKNRRLARNEKIKKVAKVAGKIGASALLAYLGVNGVAQVSWNLIHDPYTKAGVQFVNSVLNWGMSLEDAKRLYKHNVAVNKIFG